MLTWQLAGLDANSRCAILGFKHAVVQSCAVPGRRIDLTVMISTYCFLSTAPRPHRGESPKVLGRLYHRGPTCGQMQLVMEAAAAFCIDNLTVSACGRDCRFALTSDPASPTLAWLSWREGAADPTDPHPDRLNAFCSFPRVCAFVRAQNEHS